MININDSLFETEREKKRSRKAKIQQSVDDLLANGGEITQIANGISGYTPISTKQQQRGGRK